MGTWCSRSESFRWWKAFTQNLSTIVDAVKDKFWIFSGCKKVQTYSSEGRNWNYRIVFYRVNSVRIPRSWQACKKVTSPAELWIIKIIFRDPPNKLQSPDRGLVQVRLQQSSCVGIYWQSTFCSCLGTRMCWAAVFRFRIIRAAKLWTMMQDVLQNRGDCSEMAGLIESVQSLCPDLLFSQIIHRLNNQKNDSFQHLAGRTSSPMHM